MLIPGVSAKCEVCKCFPLSILSVLVVANLNCVHDVRVVITGTAEQKFYQGSCSEHRNALSLAQTLANQSTCFYFCFVALTSVGSFVV